MDFMLPLFRVLHYYPTLFEKEFSVALYVEISLNLFQIQYKSRLKINKSYSNKYIVILIEKLIIYIFIFYIYF